MKIQMVQADNSNHIITHMAQLMIFTAAANELSA